MAHELNVSKANMIQETLETRKHQRDCGRLLGNSLLRTFRKKRPRRKWIHDDEQSSSLLRQSRVSTYSNDNGQGYPRLKHVISHVPPSYREVFSPQSNLNLLVYSLLALHSIAFDQLLPVFLHLSPQAERSTNPDVQLPFKFAGGFGLDVSFFPVPTLL